MSARRSSLVVTLLIGLTHSSTAHAAPANEPRGQLEFGLAGVMLGVGIGLVAYGSVELVRTREHQRFCDAGHGGSGIDPCMFDPPALGYAAVGLSWGFSAPLLVGSGLLFGRGARVLASARRLSRSTVAEGRWRVMSVAPWWNRSGGGVSWTLQF